MKLIVTELGQFNPALAKTDPQKLADQLFSLGFETEVLAGKSPVLDISITPNRPDAMSVFGIARELEAFRQKTLKSAKILEFSDTQLIDKLPEIELDISFKDKVCTQYHGLVLEEVEVAESPIWLQEKIKLLGLRPINNIVDLTNYLMEVYGQPLHAFDLDSILGGEMHVRAAKKGEQVTTLDGEDYELKGGEPVIADREALIDLSGIMGGSNTAVDQRTTRVLLQAAIFKPDAVLRASRGLGVRTEASARYERAVSADLSWPVLNEAARLLKKKEFGRAKPTGQVNALTQTNKPLEIKLDLVKINSLIGLNVKVDQAVRIWSLLGCQVDQKLKVKPPVWRIDLNYWQDFAEEISRFVGLNDHIPSTKLPKAEAMDTLSEFEWAEGIKDRLVELGLSEVFTYSFISEGDLKAFDLPKQGELANPLNPRRKFLRTSLMPGLTRVVAENSFFDPVTVFEVGHVFLKNGEETRLGAAFAGSTDSLQAWLARIADSLGIDSADFEKAVVTHKLTDRQRQLYKIRRKGIFLIEFPLSVLKSARRIPKKYFVPNETIPYRPLSKYPPVTRDIAIVVDRSVKANDVIELIAEFHDSIEFVSMFDEYVSDSLGDNKKSLAFHILYSSLDKTLMDEEVDAIHKEISHMLEKSFNARIR